MSLLFGIEVEEHYLADAPERWGVELVEKVPEVGDVLQLHWLKESGAPGGREAHRVRVFRVDRDHGLVAHVRSLRQEVGEFRSLRERIVRDSDAAVARGWEIAPRVWIEETGLAHGECCPLAAVIMEARTHRPIDMTSVDGAVDQVAEILGVDPEWADAFLEGFDAPPGADRAAFEEQNELVDQEDDALLLLAAYELGAEMRERYCR